MKKKKNLLLIFVIILLVAGIIGGLYLIQQQQQVKEKAAPATVIYFQPSQINAQRGKTISVDVLADTGENHLAAVRLDINYNSQVIKAKTLLFNVSLLPVPLREVDLSQSGKIIGSAGVPLGNSISGEKQKIATISFDIPDNASLGETVISFTDDTIAGSATLGEDKGIDVINRRQEGVVIVSQEDLIDGNGDFNNDNIVDEIDYSILIMHFGEKGDPSQLVGDINKDGNVDEGDYFLLIENFGKQV